MKLPIIFKPLLKDCCNLVHPDENSKLYWVFYGGRGTGKSENIAATLVIAMATQPNTRVVCIREVQHSMQESVKATLEKWISELNLDAMFHITGSYLRCVNGSECFFIGLKNSNSPNIKSISNVNITFIEEASQLSEKSWRLLVPSVTRVSNPKIIIAFNPDKEDDIVYKEFVANTPPKSSYVKRVRWEDNPFFKDSSLYNVMLDDKERMPKELFNHIWEGELSKNIEDSLFKKANFTPISEVNDYSQVVIGVDPATTDTEFSNEYGIIVAGKTFKGDCRIIQDYTGKYTPREFASKVVEAYYDYNASTVIIEVNQGGDFIKSVILDIDPSLHIEEVRAGTSKQNRALPLANMMEIGTLRFIDKFPKLQRQMELTTLRGYLGPRGESPDALDAAIWAIYYLMGMSDRDTLYQVFRPEWFKNKLSNSLKSEVKGYLTTLGNLYAYIEIRGLTNAHLSQISIEKSYLGYSLPDNMCQYVVCPDIVSNYSLIDSLRASTYLKEKTQLKDRVAGLLPIFKKQRVHIDDAFISSFKNHSGVMLLLAMSLYSYKNSTETDFLIDLFCDIISLEFNIKV